MTAYIILPALVLVAVWGLERFVGLAWRAVGGRKR